MKLSYNAKGDFWVKMEAEDQKDKNEIYKIYEYLEDNNRDSMVYGYDPKEHTYLMVGY